MEKTGTVKIMQEKDKLSKIQQQTELTANISVLSTPQFWNYTGEKKEWKKERETKMCWMNLGFVLHLTVNHLFVK